MAQSMHIHVPSPFDLAATDADENNYFVSSMREVLLVDVIVMREIPLSTRILNAHVHLSVSRDFKTYTNERSLA